MADKILRPKFNVKAIIFTLFSLCFVLNFYFGFLTSQHMPNFQTIYQPLKRLCSDFDFKVSLCQQNRGILHSVSKIDEKHCFRLYKSADYTIEHLRSLAIEVKENFVDEIESTLDLHGSTFYNQTKADKHGSTFFNKTKVDQQRPTFFNKTKVDQHRPTFFNETIADRLGWTFYNETKANQYGLTFCRRFITLSRNFGRMGNRMFQVAALIGTAFKHDMIPVIPKKFPLIKYFDLPNVLQSALKNLTTCECEKSAVYYNCTKEISSGKNVSLRGYLQSWKYFKESNDVIKAVFKLKSHHMLNAKSFLSNVTLAGYQHVSIHIRRGDITRQKFKNQGYVTADLNFIDKAKQFYLNKYPKVQFFVVTNDKPWCTEYVKDVVMSPFNDPGDDMALLTLSDHVIVTTGTFGWWGAWLSGGTTVYFNQYPKPGSALELRMNRDDYYPPNWIGMV